MTIENFYPIMKTLDRLVLDLIISAVSKDLG